MQAKILRMSNDPQGAIAVLQRGLEAPQTFVQADTLVSYMLFLLFNLPHLVTPPAVDFTFFPLFQTRF
jgi:hypothetical protein